MPSEYLNAINPAYVGLFTGMLADFSFILGCGGYDIKSSGWGIVSMLFIFPIMMVAIGLLTFMMADNQARKDTE